jgi:hypothetical protein
VGTATPSGEDGIRQADASFAGSIPEEYEKGLVPLLFEPYAADLRDRIVARAFAHIGSCRRVAIGLDCCDRVESSDDRYGSKNLGAYERATSTSRCGRMGVWCSGRDSNPHDVATTGT